jgi:prepilin-type N-terminal cleavage/methylation domain-containing protein
VFNNNKNKNKEIGFTLLNSRKTNLTGFTLIEILFVMAIIAILAMIVFIAVGNAQKKARDAIRKADLAEIQKALDIYYYDNPAEGEYPGEGGCDSSKGTCGTCPCSGNNWSVGSGIWNETVAVNQIIRILPKDPVNDSTHYYWYEPTCDVIDAGGDCLGEGCCGYLLGCWLEFGGVYVLKGGYY